MDLDNDNHPHIVSSSSAKLYFFYDGSSWQSTTLNFSSLIMYPSLLIDSQNHPHIIYMGFSNPLYKICHAYHDGTNWVNDFIAVGQHYGAAISGNNKIHLSFFYQPTKKKIYSNNMDGFWTWEDTGIYDSIFGWSNGDLAVDAMQRPHLSDYDILYDGSNVKVIYYHFKNTSGDQEDPVVNINQTSSVKYGPNPFSSIISISCPVATPGSVILRIYNIRGQLIQVLQRYLHQPGVCYFEWNGRGRNGTFSQSGVYLYSLETKDKTYRGKILYFK